MKRGESKQIALEILTKHFGKKPDESWNDVIDFIHALEYKAIKAEARIKDIKEAAKGKEQIYKEHEIKYARYVKKHNALVKDSNKRISALTKSVARWKRKAEKYKCWIKKQFKKWKKKKRGWK
jgi:hypothetical protein